MKLSARLTTRGRWETTASSVELTEQEVRVIKALVQHNMKVKTAARSIPASHQYIRYNVEKLKRKTGLDPHKFLELAKLYEMVKEQENETDSR